MNITGVSFCLWSEDPDQLAMFYEKILGLKIEERINLPDDRGITLKIGSVLFFIGFHSQVKGKAKDPYRTMIGFDVKSVKQTYKELLEKGVEFILKPSLSPDKTFYVATAKDPEGNIIQFFSKQE